jgi:hypothetical protein
MFYQSVKINFKFFPAAADNAGNVAGSAAAALNGTAIKAAAGAAGTAVGLATAASSPAVAAAGAAVTAGSGLASGAAATAGSGLAAGAAATAGSGLAAGAAATAGAAVAAGSSLAVVESSKQSAVAVLKQTARQETSPLKAPLFTKFAARYTWVSTKSRKIFAINTNMLCLSLFFSFIRMTLGCFIILHNLFCPVRYRRGLRLQCFTLKSNSNIRYGT